MKTLKYCLVLLLLVIPFSPLLVVWYVFREELLELGISLMHILVVVVIVPTTLLLLFYFLSWRALLRWYGAQEVREGDLLDRAQEIAGGEVKVRLFTADIGVNALSFGGARNGFVVVSPSLLELLDDEVDEVLTHEIRGLKDKHSMVYTVVAFIAGLITSIPTLAFWGSLLTGFGQEDDPAPNLIRLFVMSLVAPIAAFLVHLVVPVNWKGELKVVKKLDVTQVFNPNPAHSFLFLVNPLKGGMTTILDFNLPTYRSLFKLNLDGVGFVKPLFFSFISYMLVCFAVVAAETFRIKDFVFLRAAVIAVGYSVPVVLFLFVLLFLLRLRNRSGNPVQDG